jgi:hypothetical protein
LLFFLLPVRHHSPDIPLTFSCRAASGALSGDGDERWARSQGDGSTSSSIEGQRGSNPRDCARAIE